MSMAVIREFQICEELGGGQSGIVYRCQSRLTRDSFAVKSIDKRLDSFHSFKYEPQILRLLSPHPNIIQLHRLYEDETHLHMVIDFCQNKDLFDLVSNRIGVLSESEARSLFTQLMKAISHCHKNGVIHQDIKPENILLDKRYRVKLADFGLAKVVSRVRSGRVECWDCVVYHVCGFSPFNGETVEEIYEAILRKDLRFPDKVIRSISTSVIDLLKRMLCKDPSRRLSAEGVLTYFLDKDYESAGFVGIKRAVLVAHMALVFYSERVALVLLICSLFLLFYSPEISNGEKGARCERGVLQLLAMDFFSSSIVFKQQDEHLYDDDDVIYNDVLPWDTMHKSLPFAHPYLAFLVFVPYSLDSLLIPTTVWGCFPVSQNVSVAK
ncbi:unnamed protein product [Dovyalis caffra]|uniref:Protein kinase domain-containing protein n=1 Tax=Dovyalis caffra TaxID=77055 RepID=A0AAV1R2D6_9ROSI|nr:unnamed protein product [Dovyalis caffra]